MTDSSRSRKKGDPDNVQLGQSEHLSDIRMPCRVSAGPGKSKTNYGQDRESR